jgi:hypothetical protein
MSTSIGPPPIQDTLSDPLQGSSIVYQPLNTALSEVRLLELHPGEDQEIRCSLHHHLLDHVTTSYEALSYVWGDQRDKALISVGNHPLEITVDLAAALRGLRHRQAPRLLWIDQVSINQEDVAERNEQVNLMQRIYESAARVVVWLGDEDESSNAAMSFIEEHAEKVDACTVDEKEDQKHQFFNNPSHETCLCAIIQRIINNPYFERYWIIQEVILAHDLIVCYGSRSTSWRTVMQFTHGILTHNRHLIDASTYQISSTIFMPLRLGLLRDERYQEPIHLFAPWDVVQKFRYCKSTVPSDRIYSWLGICDQWRQSGFQIDYNRHHHDTFKLFARAMIEHNQNLNWLCIAGSPRTLATLPSWVPDLELPPSMKPPEKLVLETATYSADRGSAVSLHFSPDSSSLFCTGVKMDQISFMTHTMLELLLICFTGRLDYTSTPPELILAATSRYGAGLKFELESLLIAKRRALLEDVDGLEESGVSVVSYIRLLHRLQKVRPELAGELNSMRLSYKSTLGRRAAFVSETGYVGLVPEYARPGDVVCVLFGSEVPMVLRKNGAHYRFVGDW